MSESEKAQVAAKLILNVPQEDRPRINPSYLHLLMAAVCDTRITAGVAKHLLRRHIDKGDYPDAIYLIPDDLLEPTLREIVRLLEEYHV